MYCNANGICNKVTELQVVANLYCIDIICITESHLNGSFMDAEVAIKGFQAHFRCDRNFNVVDPDNQPSSGGGGSVIFARDHLICSKVDWFAVPDSVGLLQLRSQQMLVW